MIMLNQFGSLFAKRGFLILVVSVGISMVMTGPAAAVEVSEEQSAILKAAAGAIPEVGIVAGPLAGLIFTPSDRVAALRREMRAYVDTSLLKATLHRLQVQVGGYKDLMESINHYVQTGDTPKALRYLENLDGNLRHEQRAFIDATEEGTDNFLLVYGSFAIIHMQILNKYVHLKFPGIVQEYTKFIEWDSPWLSDYDGLESSLINKWCTGDWRGGDKEAVREYCRTNARGNLYLSRIDTSVNGSVKKRAAEVGAYTEEYQTMHGGGWMGGSAVTIPAHFCDFRYGCGESGISGSRRDLEEYRRRVKKELQYWMTNVIKPLEELTLSHGVFGLRESPDFRWR